MTINLLNFSSYVFKIKLNNYRSKYYAVLFSFKIIRKCKGNENFEITFMQIITNTIKHANTCFCDIQHTVA